jgi:hypothetical protein
MAWPIDGVRAAGHKGPATLVTTTGGPADVAEWTALLGTALDALPELSPGGALGYLAATGKVEIPVRDAAAIFLHRRVQDSGHMVAGEWPDLLAPGRRDLAILDQDGAAVPRLEVKALYRFDVPKRAHAGGYLHGMKSGHGKDAASLHLAASHGHTCFLLSPVTHPMAFIPLPLVQVIKYAGTYNRRLQTQPRRSCSTRRGPGHSCSLSMARWRTRSPMTSAASAACRSVSAATSSGQ